MKVFNFLFITALILVFFQNCGKPLSNLNSTQQSSNLTEDNNLPSDPITMDGIKVYKALSDECGLIDDPRPSNPLQYLSQHTQLNSPNRNYYYVDINHPNASDSNNGVYVKDGGNGPWKSIYKAARTAQAGDTIVVRQGTYTELVYGDAPNSDYAAIKVKNNGEFNNPIVFMAYPGELVIVDQNNQGDGFMIPNRKHIIINGFEIKNSVTGIITYPWTGISENIFITNNHIHTIRSPENAGAIRINHVNGAFVFNNLIHDISQYVLGDDMGTGVHSYEMTNVNIQNNEFYNADKGVYYKGPKSEGCKGNGIVINNNVFYNLGTATEFNNNELTDANQKATLITHNLAYNCDSFIHDTTYQSIYQPTDFVIKNNTIVGTGVTIRGIQNTQLTHNIIYNADTDIQTVYQDHVFTSPDTRKMPGFSTIDFNNYYPNFYAKIGVYSGSQVNFDSLQSWKMAISNQNIPTLDLQSSDSNSTMINPDFTDESQNDYTLPTHHILYKNSIGAYTEDSGPVGLVK